MSAALPAARRIACALVALAVCGSLPACGGRQTKSRPKLLPPATSTTAPPSTAPATPYDIFRVDRVTAAFPSGFTTVAYPAMTPNLKDSWIAALPGTLVVPTQCRSMVVPPYVQPAPDAEAAGVDARGAGGRIQVVALRSPQPIPPVPAPQGCGLGLVVSGSPSVAGPAERVPTPQIPGVTTMGVKLTPLEENPKYLLTAALDDQTVVVVAGNVDRAANPQQLMPDLLGKAVAAVRGG